MGTPVQVRGLAIVVPTRTHSSRRSSTKTRPPTAAACASIWGRLPTRMWVFTLSDAPAANGALGRKACQASWARADLGALLDKLCHPRPHAQRRFLDRDLGCNLCREMQSTPIGATNPPIPALAGPIKWPDERTRPRLELVSCISATCNPDPGCKMR